MALKPSSKLLKSLRQRRGDDEGFTLIELMVVVLVIAILLAIAIPTFLGARERSQDRAAQSNLRNALTAAKVAYSNDGDYSAATDTHLDEIEPRLTYLASTGTSITDETIAVFAGDGCSNGIAGETSASLCNATGTWTSGSSTCSISGRTAAGSSTCVTAGVARPDSVWAGAVWSESENCWYIRDATEVDVAGRSGTTYGDNSSPADCTGALAESSAVRAQW